MAEFDVQFSSSSGCSSTVRDKPELHQKRKHSDDVDQNDENDSDNGKQALNDQLPVDLTESSSLFRSLDKSDNNDASKSDESDFDNGELPVKKQKFTFQMVKKTGFMCAEDTAEEKKKSLAPISLKLGAQKAKEASSLMKTSSASVAKAFNTEDDEEEEMPPEAKMRMRNIGRDTPTSAGPNSFGKTRQGFCDVKKMFEKQIKKKMEDVSQT